MRATIRLLIPLVLSSQLAVSSPTAQHSSINSDDLWIAAVNVELTMSVQVTDAKTRAPISGAMVRLVRSGDGKTLILAVIPGTVELQRTNQRGTARLKGGFGGNLCNCGWVEAYAGNSFIVASAPGYASSRIWVSTPSERPIVAGLQNSKASSQPPDALRFRGKNVRRKVSYHVALRPNKNA